jgi:hypothetical protein
MPFTHPGARSRAQQVASQVLQGTRRLDLQEMAGSLRALTSKDSGVTLTLTEADEGSAAARAHSAASEAQLDAVRAGNENIIRL